MTDLSAAIAPIKQALEEGEIKEMSLREQLDKQKDQNAKARRALAVLDPSYVEPKAKKQKSAKGGTGFFISTDKAQKVLDAIRELDQQGKAITQPDARDISGVAQTAVSKAFRYLRSLEIIGRAGIDPETGRERYRVLNDVDRLPDTEGKPLRRKKKQGARIPSETRIEMVRKYIADYGTDGVRVRQINGVNAFTVGALMNALTAAKYENTNWDRAKGHRYVQPMIDDGTLIDLGEQEDGYRYLTLGATKTPSWVKEAQAAWAN